MNNFSSSSDCAYDDTLGQQFDYTFDDIGNRKTAVSGGDAGGNFKRTQTYTANNLNQYTQRTVPGYLDILGSATNSATVNVNGLTASRKGDYYRAELSAANDSIALWQSITNVAVWAFGTNDMVTNATGNVFLPKTPEAFGYDADGNQTNDGRWTLTWDGENRLIKMQSLSAAPVGTSNRLTFKYDHLGRRVARTTETYVGSSWSITLSNRFIYDGWNLVAELNATNNMLINSFLWGLDLSGTMQGAGGVGGLLAITTTNASTHFMGYDGNGNVALLVSATNGITTANYEYDPFGNVLRATGPMALLNPFRFSTKYTDGESGFNYYGYRSYNPTEGRWFSRDRIQEQGGPNLMVFCGNRPISKFDVLGEQWYIFNRETPCIYWHCKLKEDVVLETYTMRMIDVETSQSRDITYVESRKCVYECVHKNWFSKDEVKTFEYTRGIIHPPPEPRPCPKELDANENGPGACGRRDPGGGACRG